MTNLVKVVNITKNKDSLRKVIFDQGENVVCPFCKMDCWDYPDKPL